MSLWKAFTTFTLLATSFQMANAIFCHQCNSTQLVGQFQCGEFFADSDIPATSCANVYGAKYCIKQVGHIEGLTIKCYQCDATLNLTCTDIIIHDRDIHPTECDHVFEAAYCIKTTGLYGGGGVGTKRFCSSSDLGSYCNYVRQPGDKLADYRSCFYTCDTDGCNSASLPMPAAVLYASFMLLFGKFFT